MSFIETSLYNVIFLEGGNVGIGTDNPTFRMDVQGDMRCETSLGIGTDGSIAYLTYDTSSNLVKCSNAANEPIFFNQGFTTKGDLITFDGTVQSILPVGVDAYVLTADSSAPNGISWQPASNAATVSSSESNFNAISVNTITSTLNTINVSNKTLSNLSLKATTVSLSNLQPLLNGVINVSASTLSNIATVSTNALTTNGANIDVSTKTLSNVSVNATDIVSTTVSTPSITTALTNINVNAKTLSNVTVNATTISTPTLTADGDTIDVSSKSLSNIQNVSVNNTTTTDLARLGANGTVLIYMNNAGNIGVGTATPLYQLHAVGDVYATGKNWRTFNFYGLWGNTVASTIPATNTYLLDSLPGTGITTLSLTAFADLGGFTLGTVVNSANGWFVFPVKGIYTVSLQMTLSAAGRPIVRIFPVVGYGGNGAVPTATTPTLSTSALAANTAATSTSCSFTGFFNANDSIAPAWASNNNTTLSTVNTTTFYVVLLQPLI